MPFAGLFGRAVVREEDFAQWARATPGVHAVRDYHILRASWRYLQAGRRKILDISTEPGPWLATLERFCGQQHELWACRQGGVGEMKPAPAGATVMPAEFDVWSPLENREAPHVLAERGFTVVTARHVVDHLYHPEPFFRALSDVMPSRGVLIVSASNVACLTNVVGLLRGGGLAGNLDALIGRHDPTRLRPRVREYCCRELNRAAMSAGFAPVGHRFYDDPAIAPAPGEWGEPTRRAIAPFQRERGQLQSEMILIFRKAGPVSAWFLRVRRRVYPLLREANAKYKNLRRRFK
jgi:hypothetical protein